MLMQFQFPTMANIVRALVPGWWLVDECESPHPFNIVFLFTQKSTLVELAARLESVHRHLRCVNGGSGCLDACPDCMFLHCCCWASRRCVVAVSAHTHKRSRAEPGWPHVVSDAIATRLWMFCFRDSKHVDCSCSVSLA